MRREFSPTYWSSLPDTAKRGGPCLRTSCDIGPRQFWGRSERTAAMKRRATLAVALAVMMVTAVSALPVAAQHTTDPSTVLLDSFDGTTQGEEHGTISYSTSLPRLDQAVDLQTGDWIKYAVPSWYTGQGSGTGTVETWVYPRAHSIALGTLQWWNTNTPPGAGYIGGLIITIDGFLYWSPWRAFSVPSAPAPTGSTYIPLNEWTHVAVTWGPGGTSLYVNGVLDGYSAGNWDPYLLSTTYVYLNGWGATDLGLVDEYRISSMARSEAEISGYVHETSPPVADAGEDQTVEATSSSGAQVTLDGSGSYDPQGDPLVYSWAENSTEITTGESPEVTLGLGVHTIELTVTDPNGASDSDEVQIEVADTTPPSLTVTLSPDTLWPPNHKYVTVTAVIDVSDLADEAPDVMLSGVASNEPDDGLGDGDMPNDIVIVDDTSVLVRAERSGLGEGRVYTLTFEAYDDSGNTTVVSAEVTVPISMKKK